MRDTPRRGFALLEVIVCITILSVALAATEGSLLTLTLALQRRHTHISRDCQRWRCPTMPSSLPAQAEVCRCIEPSSPKIAYLLP
jgi:prepilin-type N-terminal cleavage/methylation domain-containing protein